MKKFTQTLLVIFLLSSINGFGQLPTNLKTGLLAYYTFNGNAGDSSGNGNHGTVVNASLTTDRFGNNNSSYTFNGSNSYINTSFLPPTGSNIRTFAAWFKYANGFSSTASILSYGANTDQCVQAGGNFELAIYKASGNNINFRWDGVCSALEYSTAINSNWHHVVVVFDPSLGNNIGNGLIYIDGIIQNTALYNGSTLVNTLTFNNLKIGYSVSTASRYFNGSIDEVAVWNRRLSSTEVTQLYNYNSVLPIQLLSFVAKPIENNVTLNWKTANAINFSHFELEYSSEGNNFIKLATITNSLSNAYTYIHSNPLNNNYYRLKMVDNDGTFSYSAIEHVALAKKSLFISVYPNPIADNSVVAITATKASKATILVTDMTGKVISKQNIGLVTGVNKFGMGSDIFIHGYYLITVATDEAKQTIKILKK